MKKILMILVIGFTATAKEGGSSRVGGGGNGINGKPIESYAQDITSLPEYKQYIQPILAKLDTKIPALANDMRYLERNKNAYFVPVELLKMPEWIIGVYFETDQLALQTESELWVDSILYNRMRNQKDKATLLLHEMVMGLILLEKNAFVECGRYGDCRRSRLFYEDYENVRRLTNILMNRLESTSNEDLENLLMGMGYTSYHREANADLSPLDQPLSAENLYLMLSSELSAGALPINTVDLKGCGYKFNFEAGQLEILIYESKGGQPVLDSIPLRFVTTQSTTVRALPKQKLLYSMTSDLNSTWRQKLEIVADKESVTQIKVYWEELTYNYRTQTKTWRQFENGPSVSLAPNHKTCI
jgi:hypothetical protein